MKTSALILFAIFGLAIWVLGCEDHIGDSCSMDMDCSPDGDRTCDNNQPHGYCLIITCAADQCPKEAACVEFVTPSPDFEADSDSESSQTEALYTQLSPNRTRTYCLKKCASDKGCRKGYFCALDDVLDVELSAIIIDSNSEDLGVCVPEFE
ncbi:MAG: hypothetical protein JXX29_14190 [Deltaproteobacteria bacterium]|nr:hypothetical protein [Deltaproteobacteria bacterium]MBN2672828.1 hypothetical protein [Deltaproteobacteria bacterium]